MSSALLGCIIGCVFAGLLSDWLGRKKVFILASVLFIASAVGTALPRNLSEFILFRVVGGVAVGTASMLSPLYIAEIAPARIRGRLVSYNQFAIIFGMLVVYFVNYFIAARGNDVWNVQTGWRWMFGSETLPAFLFLVFLFLVPESPRWLVKKGRKNRALAVLHRLRDEAEAEQELKDIQEALALGSSQAGLGLPQGVWRTWKLVIVIGVVLAVLQQVTGINVFLYYAPDIFKKLGTGMRTALFQTIIVGAFNLSFTLVAIRTVDRLGRKPLMVIGASGMGLSLAALGLAAYFQ